MTDGVTRHARKARALLGGLLLSGVLAACGGDGSDNSGAAASSEDGNGAASSLLGMPEDISGTVTYYDAAGGEVTEALQPMFDSFEEATGVNVAADFNSTAERFFAAAESGRVPWDLILFPAIPDFLNAKEAGYLKELDTNIVPLDKVEGEAADPYGVQALSFGSIMAWDTRRFPESGPQPQEAADFFDLEKFPGRRCMMQYPQFGGTLEIALLADGVQASELYPLDVPRALEKLDTIKDQIVWWNEGAQPVQHLSNQTCSMAMVWSGRVFNARIEEGLPIEMTWEGGTISSPVLAVPAEAPDPKRGEALLSWFLQDLENQKELVNATTYATEIKDLPLSAFSEDAQQFAPLGENADAAVREDGEYYAKNIDDIVEQFNAWASR